MGKSKNTPVEPTDEADAIAWDEVKHPFQVDDIFEGGVPIEEKSSTA